MKKQTIYNQNNIEISAKNLDLSNPNYAARLILEVTNNSSDNIKISSHSFDINGLVLGQNVVTGECEAGKTTEIAVEISDTSAKISDIEIIKEIAMRLKIEKCHIENDVEVGSYAVIDGTVVEDTGDLIINTECSKGYTQAVDKNGTLLFDEKGVKFIFQSFTLNDDGTALFKAYCENNFTEAIRVQITITKINGKEYEESWKARVPMESVGFTGFTATESELEGFDTLESIELNYAVFYNGETLISTSEPITLQLN